MREGSKGPVFPGKKDQQRVLRPVMQRSEFTHFHRIAVRWGDTDALGHVNNAQIIRFLECGRIVYSKEVLGLDFSPGTGQIWVLADLHCTFHRQLHYPGELEIGTRVSRLGNRSGDINAAIFYPGEAMPRVSSVAVMVWFDFGQQRSARIPDFIRAAVKDFESIDPDI